MKIKPYIYCLITISFFSTLEVAGKLVRSDISPYAITILRFFLGGLFLLPFALKEIYTKKTKVGFRAFAGFSVSGILFVCLSMLLLQLAVYYGKVALSAVLISSNPLFVIIFATILLREKTTKYQIFSLLVGLFGLFVIIFGERNALLEANNLGLGIIYGTLAAVSFGFATVFSKKLVHHHGNLTTLCFAFLIGSVILFGYTLIRGLPFYLKVNSNTIFWTLYLSLGVTGLSYLLYFTAIEEIGAGKASMFFFLKPVIVSILAWIVHDEMYSLMQLSGIFLIVFGLSFRQIVDLFTRLNLKLSRVN